MDPEWCVCACMYGTEREGDDFLLLPSASYADLRRGSGGSASLSPVMEQLAGLLGSDLPPLPTMSTIRESASRQVSTSPLFSMNRLPLSQPACLLFLALSQPACLPFSCSLTACLLLSLALSQPASSFLLLFLSLPASFLLRSISLPPSFLLPLSQPASFLTLASLSAYLSACLLLSLASLSACLLLSHALSSWLWGLECFFVM
jgi:hypothetical protein